MVEAEVKAFPLNDFYESLGAKSEIINNNKIIRSFSDIETETYLLHNGTALRDISNAGIVELRGKDVLEFLHRVSSNSTKNLAKENIVRTIFTSEKGRIIDLTTLINFDDYQLLICNSENQNKVMSWIDKYVITDDVQLSDKTGKYAFLELLGPQADSFMTLVCGNIINDIVPGTFRVVNNEGIIFFVVRLSNEDSKKKFWILADHNNGKQLIGFMLKHKGPFDFGLIGEDAYIAYRVEQGIPEAPDELNDNYNPHEARILDSVDFAKGCYIGQEVIARLETYDKVQKYLMGIVFDSEPDINSNYILHDIENREAGNATTIVYSQKCQKFIGLAYVKKAFCIEGVELTAKNEKDSSIKVFVKNLPFKK